MTMHFAPPAVIATTPLQIGWADDPADPALAGPWADLAATSATANPFYERSAVVAACGLPGVTRPRLLLGWRDTAAGPRLDALLPIAVRRPRAWLPATIENWDQRARALGEPLIRAGAETCFWDAALPALAREGLWLRLSALDADSASTRALRTLAPAAETRRYARAILEGGTTAAAHRAEHIRGKVLKEHRRLRARLAEQGRLTFERLAPEVDPHPWIDALFALEASGWKGREGVAASADPATQACYRDMIAAAHAAGSLDFHRMRVGDRTVAALAVLERGPTAFQLKIAYDEDYAAFSPGVLLEMAYLDHALDVAGHSLVDSCARAGHPMIDRLWPARRAIVSLAVPLPTARSRLAVAVFDRFLQFRNRR